MKDLSLPLDWFESFDEYSRLERQDETWNYPNLLYPFALSSMTSKISVHFFFLSIRSKFARVIRMTWRKSASRQAGANFPCIHNRDSISVFSHTFMTNPHIWLASRIACILKTNNRHTTKKGETKKKKGETKKKLPELQKTKRNNAKQKWNLFNNIYSNLTTNIYEMDLNILSFSL